MISDTEEYEIFRFEPKGEKGPSDFLQYFLSSFILNYHGSCSDLGYWLKDLQNRFEGIYCNYTRDFFYAVKINGTFVGRLWFAFSRKSGFGNFGHICTEPDFRRKGILHLLMKQFEKDFQIFQPRFISCATGNPIAAKCYSSYGFSLPFGGETGPLIYGEDFQKLQQEVFSIPSVRIRPGNPADQFDCDKFLAIVPDLYMDKKYSKSSPLDFRTSLINTISGNGVLNVLENENGIAVGYAFAQNNYPENLIDFLIHPVYWDNAELLLRQTIKEFYSKYSSSLTLCCSVTNDAVCKRSLLEKLNFKQISLISADLWILDVRKFCDIENNPKIK